MQLQPQLPEAYYNIPRRQLEIEDYFDILRRHKGWIFGPFFAALVVAVVAAFMWPNTFVSTATIRVVPSQVPESYVASNVNVQLSERVNAMYQTISNRTNLTNIITTFNLYPKDQKSKPMEDVLEGMKRDIKISSVMSMARNSYKDQISAFQIAFSYSNRLTAQKITADLVSRFMNENTRERTQRSFQTTQFLRDQLEGARKDLEGIEEKLSNFRQTFQGRLPDQVGQNQVQATMLEQRINNLNNSLSRVGQEKILLESELRTSKNQRASLVASPVETTHVQRRKNDHLMQMENSILRLEGTLASAREQWKENHPDVRRLQGQLNVARKMRDKIQQDEEAQEAAAAVSSPTTPRRPDAVYDKEARMLDANIERLEAQLKAKDAEADEYRKEILNAERTIRLVQSRIEATPLSERQYADVVRDREVAKMKYDDLNKARQKSEIASELEKRQQGETLEILDSASLPGSPTLPNRPLIVAMGAAVGLVIGLTLAGVREAKDTSLKNLKDVRAYTQLTVLGSVPLLENDLVVRRRKRLSWLAWSTACLAGIAIMAAAVSYYFLTLS